MKAFVFAFALALGACSFSPDIADGTIACAPDGTCPPDFACGEGARCFRVASHPIDAAAAPPDAPPDAEPDACHHHCMADKDCCN